MAHPPIPLAQAPRGGADLLHRPLGDIIAILTGADREAAEALAGELMTQAETWRRAGRFVAQQMAQCLATHAKRAPYGGEQPRALAVVEVEMSTLATAARSIA